MTTSVGSSDDEGRLAVRAAAVVGGDDAAVGGRVGVAAGARPSAAASRPAAGRSRRSRTGRARAGPWTTPGPNSPAAPAAHGLAAALAGHHPLAAQPELEGDDAALGVLGGVVVDRVGRRQARVVLGGGQHVADGEVAGAQPLVPGHPGGGEQRRVAGQQHDLVDGDRRRRRGRGRR